MISAQENSISICIRYKKESKSHLMVEKRQRIENNKVKRRNKSLSVITLLLRNKLLKKPTRKSDLKNFQILSNY